MWIPDVSRWKYFLQILNKMATTRERKRAKKPAVIFNLFGWYTQWHLKVNILQGRMVILIVSHLPPSFIIRLERQFLDALFGHTSLGIDLWESWTRMT